MSPAIRALIRAGESAQVIEEQAYWEAVSGIAIGYPGDPQSLSEELRKRELTARTRKPLASFVFTESWGKSAPL